MFNKIKERDYERKEFFLLLFVFLMLFGIMSGWSQDLGGVYRLRSAYNGRYLETSYNGLVRVTSRDEGNRKLFNLFYCYSDYYNIENMRTDRGVLDTESGGIIQWIVNEPPYSGMDSLWEPTNIRGNFYRFNNVWSGREYMYTDGTNVYYNTGGTNVKTIWQLVPSEGSLDTSFWDVGFIVDDTVQDDGKVIIVGDFTKFNGTSRKRIARLHTNGSLDTSLNPGTGANDSINCIEIQSDGMILIGGDFTSYNGVSKNRITRLLSDGSIDTFFNTGTGANGTVNCIAVQSNGKIIIAGNFNNFNGTYVNKIARLNADGTLDNTFNPITGTYGPIYSVDVHTNGKIIIGGAFMSYDGTSIKFIARLNSNGSLDTSFDPGTGPDSPVYSVNFQNDGKIIMAGAFTSYNNRPWSSIIRLNTDGSIDSSFDTGTGTNDYGQIYSTATHSDGNIIAVGYFTEYYGIQRDNVVRIHGD